MSTQVETAVLGGSAFAGGPFLAALLLLLVVLLISPLRGAAMEQAR
jgi:hypothetical protein